MGYDPTAWRKRRMEDFWIPIKHLREFGFTIQVDFKDGKAILSDLEPPEWLLIDFSLGDVFSLGDGNAEGGMVQFVDFHPCAIYAEDYGRIEKLLEKSIGLFEYVLVWESGDSVEIITWKDGEKETESIV